MEDFTRSSRLEKLVRKRKKFPACISETALEIVQ